LIHVLVKQRLLPLDIAVGKYQVVYQAWNKGDYAIIKRSFATASGKDLGIESNTSAT
jgi:hypothetical protein